MPIYSHETIIRSLNESLIANVVSFIIHTDIPYTMYTNEKKERLTYFLHLWIMENDHYDVQI